jgi:putative salt-induced outer membrane protein YdiY
LGCEISGNLNFQSGNTDSQRLNPRTFAQRRTVQQRISAEYIGNYDETDGEATSNNHRLSADWDRFITNRLFWSPIFLEYFKDRFKNIEHRVTLGPAIGYEIIDTPRTSWSASGGPAYTHTWFEQVNAGEDDNRNSLALLARTRVDHELTGDIDLWYDYRFLVGSKETGGYSHRMELGSSFDIFGELDVRASYVWDFISDPVEEDQGSTPEREDNQLLLGVGYSF